MEPVPKAAVTFSPGQEKQGEPEQIGKSQDTQQAAFSGSLPPAARGGELNPSGILCSHGSGSSVRQDGARAHLHAISPSVDSSAALVRTLVDGGQLLPARRGV